MQFIENNQCLKMVIEKYNNMPKIENLKEKCFVHVCEWLPMGYP